MEKDIRSAGSNTTGGRRRK